MRNRQSPGDVLTLTAAVESLHRQYPGRYLTAVDTTAPEIWEHNPRVVPAEGNERVVEMSYPLIDQSNQRPVHFLEGWVEHLGRQLGIPLVLNTNRPHLYLSDEEVSWMGRVEEVLGEPAPYWIVNAGTKHDFTCKQWPVESYQEVVDRLAGRVRFVQVGLAEHRHPRLRGVIDQVGRTTTRELIRLAYHASGGLGPSTFLQHLCAAWEKPYVCLLGGREPVSWVQYPRQVTLHTVGALDCCRGGACWRSRVVPLGDGDEQDKSLCELPVLTDPPAPQCMAMIEPGEVVRAIERYL